MKPYKQAYRILTKMSLRCYRDYNSKSVTKYSSNLHGQRGFTYENISKIRHGTLYTDTYSTDIDGVSS